MALFGVRGLPPCLGEPSGLVEAGERGSLWETGSLSISLPLSVSVAGWVAYFHMHWLLWEVCGGNLRDCGGSLRASLGNGQLVNFPPLLSVAGWAPADIWLSVLSCGGTSYQN